MDLQRILENEELNKLLKHSIESTYHKYKLYHAIELDDFCQETYMFIIPRLKKFDDSKSTLRTYIPMLVMTSANRVLEKEIGQSKNVNKLQFKKEMLSMDYKNPNVKGDEVVSFAEFIEEDFNLENEVMKNMLIDAILNLETLSPTQKNITQLMLKGYNGREISEKMDCSQTNISQHFNRAKEKILLKFTI